jgi:macrolide-specific efflux system membrane fusion protein
MKKVVWGLVTLGAVAVPLALLGRAATRAPDRPGGPAFARVTRRDIGSMVKATGVIKPMIGAEVRVGSRASGVVERLFVRIGDPVRKGQLLAELDLRDLLARSGQATAALESARASASYAQADLQRKRDLAKAQLISRSDLDLAERAAAVAEQQQKEAEATLDFARTELGYGHIDAPIAGIVASISTQEGETVAASFAAPTFVTLLDLSRLEVWAYVDETDIGRIRTGQEARFTVDTYPGQEFAGRVTAIYPQAELRDNVVNYVTVVRFDAPKDATLRPEMTTAVKITLESHPQVLVVPRRAVRRDGNRAFVLSPRGAETVQVWVTTGSRDENGWEIVSGLREGDEVIVGEAAAAAASTARE